MKLLTYLIILLGTLPLNNIAQTTSYQEKYRPQFHFSPPAHWMNDPNGMVYYKGEYHLFYQYYPNGTVWGPMHWGHAISTNLIHWQNLPIALYPDSLGYIFSGSVVVDKQNTSGFQKGSESPLVAIFTYHNMPGEKKGNANFQTQGIAYSLDKGRTWKKYMGNPVIKNPGIKDFRDPKVKWNVSAKKWVMTLAVGNQVNFYQSANLIHWELTGSFGSQEGNHGGVWECPDLIEIKTTLGNTSKWILIVSVGTGAPNGGSGTQYFIGHFNGKTFINDNPKDTTLWLDYGTDNYAGVTWNDAPGDRQLFIGWMSNWQYAQVVPTKTWRSAMTIPRELHLTKTSSGIRLILNPVQELKILRGESMPINFKQNKKYPFSPIELILQFDLEKTSNDDFGIELSNACKDTVRIGYCTSKNEFYIDRRKQGGTQFSTYYKAKHHAPRLSTDKKMNMHLLIDQSSIELFADDGSVVMTELVFPDEQFTHVYTFQKNNIPILSTGKMYTFKSIWH